MTLDFGRENDTANLRQYLLSSRISYTCTNLAEPLEGLDHNSVYRYLKSEKLTPRLLWEKAGETLAQSAQACLIFDDTVVDKSYSFEIEGVRRRYSGNAHGVIKGIGIVNPVSYHAGLDRYRVIDYRLFDPERDGKTKLDHVSEMLDAVERRGLRFGTVLMDAWYATAPLMTRIHRAGELFYCPIKKNRLVDETRGQEPYRGVETLNWTEAEEQQGKVGQGRRVCPGRVPETVPSSGLNRPDGLHRRQRCDSIRHG